MSFTVPGNKAFPDCDSVHTLVQKKSVQSQTKMLENGDTKPVNKMKVTCSAFSKLKTFTHQPPVFDAVQFVCADCLLKHSYISSLKCCVFDDDVEGRTCLIT